jgi:cobaltochelatase CobS
MANKIDQLKAIINDPKSSSDNIARAQQLLDEQLRISSAVANTEAEVVSKISSLDDEVQAIITNLEKALRASGGNVNISEVRRIVLEEFAKRKIKEADLSPDLLAKIVASRPVSLTLTRVGETPIKKEVSGSFLQRPIVQLLLSDLLAQNNAYLYGGAGTGKTFVAEEIADLVGWEKITLNCNQFTSPLDILGGQTIDGYQEGKLSMAWSNEIINADGTMKKVDGVVLILDELPKIDPNTAGILNEALAKVKDKKFDEATKTWKKPTIRNGKNKVLPLGNLFVIATGNVPLNTIDPDYEANFKQDLSLQDRFIGSTYRVFVDYDFEFNDIMKGYAFIWIFLVKVRQEIEKLRATGQAFVSLRLMINAKATYREYRVLKASSGSGASALTASTAISKPKTLIDTMDNFFGLFKPATREALLNVVQYDKFKQIVAEKDKMPFNPSAPDFDTASEITEGKEIINKYKASQKVN